MALLALILALTPAARASFTPPQPAVAPVVNGCTFIPNSRTNTSYNCQDPAAPVAIANSSVAFQVNVSDASTNNITVRFYFDYYNAAGVNANSPVRTVNVTSPGLGVPASANASWTYGGPNANLTGGPYIVHINVTNDANESASPEYELVVYVTYDRPPSMGIQSTNSVSQAIKPVNPVIPLVYENVTVYDPDSDPLTLTWEWGDGTWTITKTPPSTAPLALSVTHQYPLSLFPLNETPRYVEFPVHVWVNDGFGHNESYNSTTVFYEDWDFPPNVRIEQPLPGSIWKVGEPVTMVGNSTDPEGSPTTSYWDFDARNDTTHTGDPTRNQDAIGTTAIHAYSVAGFYNATFWSTDGNKLSCGLDPANCTNGTSHWRAAVLPLQIVNNSAPRLAINNYTAVAGTPLAMSASVYDADGDNLTLRWSFGDGTPDVTDTTPRVPRGSASPSVTVLHNYTEPGLHTLTVNVSDGNLSVEKNSTILVQSFNLPPVLLAIAAHYMNGTEATNNTFLMNETFSIDVSVYDPENDTLSVSVDWADGSSSNHSADPKASSECVPDNRSRLVCIVTFTHVYPDIGSRQYRNYTIVVSVTDHQVYLQQNLTGGPPISLSHTKMLSLTVFITNYQSESMGPWDWWDYSTLAAVIGVPALLVGRFALNVRREREEL